MDRHGVMWQVSTQVPFPTIPLKLAQLFERSLRFCRCRRFLWLVSKKTHLYRIYVIYYMYPSIYMPYFQLVEQCAKRIKKDINKVFIGDKFDNSWVMFLVIKADNSKSSIFLGPHFRRTDDMPSYKPSFSCFVSNAPLGWIPSETQLLHGDFRAPMTYTYILTYTIYTIHMLMCICN